MSRQYFFLLEGLLLLRVIAIATYVFAKNLLENGLLPAGHSQFLVTSIAETVPLPSRHYRYDPTR